MNTQISPEKLKFGASVLPALETGTYTLRFDQDLAIEGALDARTFTSQMTFVVRGERWGLEGKQIHSCYPPEGGQGKYAACLPHLVIKNSSLPWQRTAAQAENLPWLALLILDDAELDQCSLQTRTLAELVQDQPDRWSLESGESPDRNCSTLTLPANLREQLIPTRSDLAWLAHTREVESGGRFAVITAHRLPKEGANSTALLVSLEGYYDPENQRRYPNNESGEVTLAVLHRWTFADRDPEKETRRMLEKLTQQTDVLKLPARPGEHAQSASLRNLGYTLLPYHFRDGQSTYAFYRGPLLPCAPASGEYTLVANPDALVKALSGTGLPDLSRAMAWQMGRLLALDNLQFATSLLKWKRAEKVGREMKGQSELERSLRAMNQAESGEEQNHQQIVKDWLSRLQNLNGVPFSYLVPEEAMLPEESVRFFRLDPNWIQALLDGAFSIGRGTARDLERDQALIGQVVEMGETPLSGMLVRSEMVKHWPGTALEALDQGGNILPLYTQLEYAPGVLLCVFAGEIARLHYRQSPESLHYGLSVHESEGNPAWTVTPRSLETGQLTSQQVAVGVNESRVVEIAALAAALQSENSAQFALQMVSGREEIEFIIQN
ncbi:MAG: hypothetical protein H6581_14815 [Bacteroidia bacterium]|nr:hypothetical protein [Bacteroidia bacterium]